MDGVGCFIKVSCLIKVSYLIHRQPQHDKALITTASTANRLLNELKSARLAQELRRTEEVSELRALLNELKSERLAQELMRTEEASELRANRLLNELKSARLAQELLRKEVVSELRGRVAGLTALIDAQVPSDQRPTIALLGQRSMMCELKRKVESESEWMEQRTKHPRDQVLPRVRRSSSRDDAERPGGSSFMAFICDCDSDTEDEAESVMIKEVSVDQLSSSGRAQGAACPVKCRSSRSAVSALATGTGGDYAEPPNGLGVTVQSPDWPCLLCSFLNDPAVSVCKICKNQRPISKRAKRRERGLRRAMRTSMVAKPSHQRRHTNQPLPSTQADGEGNKHCTDDDDDMSVIREYIYADSREPTAHFTSQSYFPPPQPPPSRLLPPSDDANTAFTSSLFLVFLFNSYRDIACETQHHEYVRGVIREIEAKETAVIRAEARKMDMYNRLRLAWLDYHGFYDITADDYLLHEVSGRFYHSSTGLTLIAALRAHVVENKSQYPSLYRALRAKRRSGTALEGESRPRIIRDLPFAPSSESTRALSTHLYRRYHGLYLHPSSIPDCIRTSGLAIDADMPCLNFCFAALLLLLHNSVASFAGSLTFAFAFAIAYFTASSLCFYLRCHRAVHMRPTPSLDVAVLGGGGSLPGSSFANPVPTSEDTPHPYGISTKLAESYRLFEHDVADLACIRRPGDLPPLDRLFAYHDYSCHCHITLATVFSVIENTAAAYRDSSPLSCAFRLCYERRLAGCPLHLVSLAFRRFFNGTKLQDDASCMGGEGKIGSPGPLHSSLMVILKHPHQPSHSDRRDHFAFQYLAPNQQCTCAIKYKFPVVYDNGISLSSSTSASHALIEHRRLHVFRHLLDATSRSTQCPKCDQISLRTTTSTPSLLKTPSVLFFVRNPPGVPPDFEVEYSIRIDETSDTYDLVSAAYANGSHFWGDFKLRSSESDETAFIRYDDMTAAKPTRDGYTSHTAFTSFDRAFLHVLTYVKRGSADCILPPSNYVHQSTTATTPPLSLLRFNALYFPHSHIHMSSSPFTRHCVLFVSWIQSALLLLFYLSALLLLLLLFYQDAGSGRWRRSHYPART